jgi:hypothetical protein
VVEFAQHVGQRPDISPRASGNVMSRYGQGMPDPSKRADELRDLDVQSLIRMCEDGDDAACLELDRRGVEPPLLEVDYPGPLPLAA